MKLATVALFILLSINKLYAQLPKDICYSIQIGFFQNSSLKAMREHSFPKECQIIPKEDAYVIKCECDTEENIRKKLSFYKKSAPDAFVTTIKRKNFEQNSLQKSRSIQKKRQKSQTKEMLNELMYKVFIYNNDLKNAQKVAKTALKQNPKDLIWRKYLADALSWDAKSKEAFKHYMYIYEKEKKDPTLKFIVDDYGNYESFFTLLGKIYSDPKDEKNLDKFFKVAQKLGNLKEATVALDKAYQKTKDPTILRKSAQFYYRVGFQQEAMRYLSILKKKRLLDIESAMTLSKIFFAKRKFTKSLNTLLSVEHLATKDDKEYWYLLSDIYSYHNQNDKASKLLRALCVKNECRKQDYDRLIFFYFDRDKDYASQIALKAFKKFKERSYFFSFAKINLTLKRAQVVNNLIKTLSYKEKREYEKLPLYWLIVASVNEQQGFFDEVVVSYQKALALDPYSTEILSQYGWFLMAKNRENELLKILPKIEKKAKSDARLYILAAAINYKLNRVKKAYNYYQKALKNEPENIDIKLDSANLLTIMGERQRAYTTRKSIYTKLQKQLTEKPKLLNEKEFLIHYLRASTNFISTKNYKMVLDHAKDILDKRVYLNLLIAWKLSTGSDEYAEYLSKKLKEPELWLQSYFAIRDHDTYKMKDLLYRYAMIMPISSKINSQIKTKQIGKARINTFLALQESPKNRSLYRTKYEIDREYGNKFNTEVAYQTQGELKNSYAKIENLLYLTNRFYLGNSFYYGKNSYNELKSFDNNKEDSSARLWLKILIDSGYMKLGGGYRNSYTQNFQYFFNLYSKVNSKLGIEVEVEKNRASNETTDLFLRGEEDYLKFSTRYQFNSRLAMQTDVSTSRYRLQNGDVLGTGEKYYLKLQQNIKFAYPNITIREHFLIANFSDQSLREELPNDYIEGGVGIEIGKTTTNRYNSTWRPYADLSTTYHNRFGLLFAGQVGISGRFIGNDYLNLFLNYNRLASDNTELWMLKLNHSYLY